MSTTDLLWCSSLDILSSSAEEQFLSLEFEYRSGPGWLQLPRTGPWSYDTIPQIARDCVYPRLHGRTRLDPIFPAEILNNILFHAHYRSDIRELRARRNTHPSHLDQLFAHTGPNHISFTTTCSLVCRAWGIKCREYLFSGANLVLSSPEDVRTFILYETKGCSSLVPISSLVGEIHVEQTYEAPYSFCHLLHLPRSNFIHRLMELHLVGPIPIGMPAHKLATPHWSIPPFLKTPPAVLSFPTIRVTDIHLPSFSHVARYVGFLEFTSNVVFDSLTWNTSGTSGESGPSTHVRRKPIHQTTHLTVHATRCTNDFGLSLLAMMTSSRCLVHALPDNEFQWFVALISLVYDSFPALRDGQTFEFFSEPSRYWQEYRASSKPAIGFTVNPNLNHRSCIFKLGASDWRSNPNADMHVVGLQAHHCIEDGENMGIFDELLTFLERFSNLRAVVICFDSLEKLRDSMQRYRPVRLDPLGNGLDLNVVLVYPNNTSNEANKVLRRTQDEWVALDPITQVPTGRTWPDESVILDTLIA